MQIPRGNSYADSQELQLGFGISPVKNTEHNKS